MNAQVAIQEAKNTAPANKDMDVWQSFRREMDQMFDRLTGNFGFPSFADFPRANRFWPQLGNAALPAVDLMGDEKGYKVTAELPGIDEKDVEVMLRDDYLSIKAEKRQAHDDKSKDYFVSERNYGVYQRTFALPTDADRGAIGAKFEKGVLTVTLPKSAKAAVNNRKIEVKAA
jgi:HSP20 family protein